MRLERYKKIVLDKFYYFLIQDSERNDSKQYYLSTFVAKIKATLYVVVEKSLTLKYEYVSQYLFTKKTGKI